MNAYLLICKESLKAMRSVHAMVLCAVFVALNVLLGSFTIEIGKILEISFTSLAAAACSYCCGPFLGAMGGVAADLIKFMMRPSIFFIGFTFNELLLGLIYGFAFYHKPITWKRVIITRAIVTIVLNLILTSLWLNMLYGSALFAAIRVWKNILLFPIECFMLYTILKTCERVAPALLRKKQ